ncbi:hypothetical protein QWM81_16100 [Streptomyces ficellus]|uniref:Uncharacterized protein n=1 Tax=Streptomyces ficellus TaxID=1977088 RepID=A0ABT7Z7S1_9ACTN|nr:hypothetical protein [Streptomyces ficellus]MDN3295545.1 hypothetical protein [Streptomyces ficellus]
MREHAHGPAEFPGLWHRFGELGVFDVLVAMLALLAVLGAVVFLGSPRRPGRRGKGPGEGP